MTSWMPTLWRQRSARRVPRAPATFRPMLEELEGRALPSSAYMQTNLVSDIPGLARTTDPNLVNPWGLVLSPTRQFAVADNGSGLSTAYTAHGQRLGQAITIPP